MDSHVRAAEWTSHFRHNLPFNLARTLRGAEAAGYELRRNQVDQLWYWQPIASSALDWRGSGYRTKSDAARAFDQGVVGL